MQLKHSKKSPKKVDQIGKTLAAATCALLAGQSGAATTGDPGTWRVDAAILGYSEDNSRVQAIEPVISATRYGQDESELNLKLVVDSLTGASPNGATPSDQVQTFTRPSGKGATYTVDANAAPLDDSFKDTRVALSANWTRPLNSVWTYTVGAYGSSEYDYQSLGVNGRLSRYFNQKNTQLNFGLSASSDTVKPVGEVPDGLARVAIPGMANFDAAFAATRIDDSDTKTLVDLLVGVSQVINKRTIMQFNYSYSQSDGYLTDPYKILSVIDETPGADYGATLEDGSGIPVYIHEQRPDSRTKHAFYWQAKHMFANENVIDGSYRFMTDDWGVTSHTLELKYRVQFDSWYLEPHLRYYQQSEADFYRRFILSSEYQAGLPDIENASADYRLGELTGTTVGIKYGRKMQNGNSMSVRLEYFTQSNSGEKGFGELTSHDLYPETNAVMFTVGYSF